jgi:hypothetical protein
MQVKNISKKIIGNQSFRMLPGETMEVNGGETWVKMYLENGKLQQVLVPEAPASEPASSDGDANSEDDPKTEDQNEATPSRSAKGKKKE